MDGQRAWHTFGIISTTHYAIRRRARDGINTRPWAIMVTVNLANYHQSRQGPGALTRAE